MASTMASSICRLTKTITLISALHYLISSTAAEEIMQNSNSNVRSTPSLLYQQARALIDVKYHLTDPLGNLRSWKLPSNDSDVDVVFDTDVSKSVCSWRGISCCNGDGNKSVVITALDISSMNLSGSLSPSISYLKAVVNLSVAGNQIAGNLPPEITSISTLRYLNISGNQLTGALPEDIFRLQSLEVFDAFNNNLAGLLPVGITRLPNLVHLHLGGNFFSGHIHPQFGNLQNLRYLNLAANNLTGRIPAELGNLQNLRELYLGYFNQFEGAIPMELGSLSSLVVLDLSQSGLSGTIPPSLGFLRNLKTLLLQNNFLVGAVPPSLGNLTNISALDLSNNSIAGTIPKELCRLRQLQLLNLLMNFIHGSIPPCIGELSELQELKLFNNNLTGNIPAQLGKSTPNLVRLDLADNGLTGPIPEEICFGRKLQWLLLLGNHLSGQIPESLTYCETLTRIRLGNNKFSGKVPAGLFFLPDLEILELSRNCLAGPPLPEVAATSSVISVTIVDLADNLLSGAISPSAIARMIAIEKLDLSNNRITGLIPEEIGLLGQHLSRLDLSHNFITGPLPASLSQCFRLSDLNVSRNRLTGSIPPSLGSMPQLATVDLSYNDFIGVVPPSRGVFTAASLRGNPALCGELVLNRCAAQSEAASTASDDASQLQSASNAESWTRAAAITVMVVLFGAAAAVLCIGLLMTCRKTNLAEIDNGDSWRWGLDEKLIDLVRVYLIRGLGCWRCIGEDEDRLSKHLRSSWKLVKFNEAMQDFTVHDVLRSLEDENIIGQGGTGTVYKGEIGKARRNVAIKRLPAGTLAGSGSLQQYVASSTVQQRLLINDHGFSAEIKILGSVSHRNIVKLLGWCSNGHTNLLLYDYIPNGSLGELLHGHSVSYRNSPSSTADIEEAAKSWSIRFNIALGAAEGLSYLHHDCQPPILHRDIKPNNILLDSKWEPKIGDFGLAKPMHGAESMSAIAGSYGYLAPEYTYTLKVNEKSDVFSYGVVLLEILTGLKPIGPQYGECLDIVKWIRSCIHTEAQCIDILDPRIKLHLSQSPEFMCAALLLFKVAMKCADDDPQRRPSLRDVVKVLKELSCPDYSCTSSMV